MLGWVLGRVRGPSAQTAGPADPVRSTPATKHPDVDVRGATEAVEIADAVKGMLQRIWKEQDRTKAALASARDFSAVSAHELRTPLTAMRTNLEVLSTLDLPEEQRKEVVNDVIRTQSRIEATLGALERLAQGELSTSDDHVPVDITELLDRAAHDAMRVYPDLEVSLIPAPTVIIVGLPAGLRLAVDNAIANAVKHGGATRVQLSAVSSRAGVEIAIDDDGVGIPRRGAPRGVRPVLPRVNGIAFRLRAWPGAGRPTGRIARRHSLFGGQPAWRRPPAAESAVPPLAGGQQVDDENQGLAGQPVPAARGAVGLLGWNDQLPRPPTFMPGMPSCQPWISPRSGNSIDSPRFQELSNSSPVSYSTPT